MRLLGLLYRLKEVRNLSSLVTYYKALISPKLEYCSPIWSMASPTHLSRLNSVLNFFLAIVRFRIPTTRSMSKQDLLNTLNLHPPEIQRKIADLKSLCLNFIFAFLLDSLEAITCFIQIGPGFLLSSARSYIDCPNSTMIYRWTLICLARKLHLTQQWDAFYVPANWYLKARFVFFCYYYYCFC